MEIHKWIQSEKACKDLGQQCMLEWIEKYAATFRKEWTEKHGLIEEENGVCCTSCSGVAA